MMTYQTIEVDGLSIFYREAGDQTKPTMLLLHGFPSASHMFRDLMPALADRFHLIAPDFPGFGQSSAPSHDDFSYTFDHLTAVITDFLQALNLTQFYLYVFDYGAPIGFRIAMAHPDWIEGIVSQNGNIYQEGLGPKWATRQDFWDHPTTAKRDSYRSAFASKTIIGQYTFGTQPNRVSPDGYLLDIAYTQSAGYAERQLDLIYDYQNNIKLYPKFQAYLRAHQPKLLAVWGKNDPSFIYPGAEAFKRDDQNTDVELVDSGHFALETHAVVIAAMIKNYFE
ncbi:alpha/beta fold hydrolase [Lactiplantibacillus pingfangensis]|uniref:alpha/beta fold hydrolase n=1 Tax=Lactiplantibacillus pingfangensis TaxID=2559915 RepID=UPI0010F4D4F5|nr:alpha/beta hydrolase [Lactiplantibacillus pingfangensis]